MTERLQKILSQWGIASRRQAQQMIVDGQVQVNGSPAYLGQKVDPTSDRIAVKGVVIQPDQQPQPVYLLLHKPAGVVSTCHDPQHRQTVLDLLPTSMQLNQGIHPVGRLDADSTGALLLTNDGNLTFCLTHPRHHLPKTYHVWVEGHPAISKVQQWRQGVMLDGKPTLPAQVKVLQQHPDRTLLEIILVEGRNRQIRRVAEQLGHPVLQLHRVAIGSIELGDLARGRYRPLTPSEIDSLQTRIDFLPAPTI